MSNGNEHDPIDRLLNDAFRSRPQPDRGTASIADVRRRARRRQNTRVGGTLGAVALVGIGGVAVVASRSPGSVRTSAADITSTTSDGNIATACQLTLQPTYTTIDTIEGTWATDVAITAESDGYSTTTSTTTSTFPDNTSSYPATTIEVLDPLVTVSTVIWINLAPSSTDPAVVGAEGCAPVAGGFRCAGRTGSDSQGFEYFEYCERTDLASEEVVVATSTTIAP